MNRRRKRRNARNQKERVRLAAEWLKAQIRKATLGRFGWEEPGGPVFHLKVNFKKGFLT